MLSRTARRVGVVLVGLATLCLVATSTSSASAAPEREVDTSQSSYSRNHVKLSSEIHIGGNYLVVEVICNWVPASGSVQFFHGFGDLGTVVLVNGIAKLHYSMNDDGEKAILGAVYVGGDDCSITRNFVEASLATRVKVYFQALDGGREGYYDYWRRD